MFWGNKGNQFCRLKGGSKPKIVYLLKLSGKKMNKNQIYVTCERIIIFKGLNHGVLDKSM